MTIKTLIRFFFSITALIFILLGIKQIQDHFIGYGFVSIGIAAGIIFLTFKNRVRNIFNN